MLYPFALKALISDLQVAPDLTSAICTSCFSYSFNILPLASDGFLNPYSTVSKTNSFNPKWGQSDAIQSHYPVWSAIIKDHQQLEQNEYYAEKQLDFVVMVKFTQHLINTK